MLSPCRAQSAVIYRSAVLFGEFTQLDGPEKEEALDVLTDRLLPGRTGEIRRPTGRELAATLLLAMPIREWSLRSLDDWPEDPADDVAGPAWAGQLRFGPPSTTVAPAPDLRDGIPVPASVSAVAGVRCAPRPPRRGSTRRSRTWEQSVSRLS